MKHLFLLVFFFVSAASADLKPGIYTGVDAAGAKCEFKIIGSYFDMDEPHPLNERVAVEWQGLSWDVMHPPVLQPDKGYVRFDHDHFQQLVPRDFGAEGLWLDIDHSGAHMPTRLRWFEDHYKEPQKNRSIDCSKLSWSELK